MRLKLTNAYSKIELAEKGVVPNEVQVLRVGKFNHPQYGKFEVTKKVLSEMVKNFNDRVRGVDVGFDYYHESDKDASGWPKNLELREDGNELWATEVEWTETAAKKLGEKALRYFSPDFSFAWKDPESGKVFNNVLFGGGLTNRPFVKEMKAITAAETEGDNMKTELEIAQDKIKELESANVKLAEEKTASEKKLAEMPSGDVAALKAQIAELQAKLKAAEGDSEKALADKKLAEKTSAFNVLLSEGKAVAAQKDAYISGDMDEFLKLSAPVNLKGNGTVVDQGKEADERDDKVMKLAEEKVKADPKLAMGDAIKLANKEVK